MAGDEKERKSSSADRLRTPPEGRYLGFEVVGRGGMGIVYEARDTELNRRVAIKMVYAAAPGQDMHVTPASPLEVEKPTGGDALDRRFEELRTRFLQEVYVTARLEHPGVVPVYEVGQTGAGVPYYAMRLMRDGRTLERAIKEAQSLEDRLELLEPFLRVCDTISFAHSRSILHRDLKPDNVVLGEYGEVVVLDWGLASVREESPEGSRLWHEVIEEFKQQSDYQTHVRVGTPGYMPPEILGPGPSGASERGDVYSLGAVLYRILSGEMPYAFDTPGEYLQKVVTQSARPLRELAPEVPAGLAQICQRAVARDPSERIESAAALAGALREWRRQSERDREVAGLRNELGTVLEGAAPLTGPPLLEQLDRAGLVCARLAELAPEDASVRAEQEALAARREQALRERDRTARHRLLRRVGIAAGVLLVLGVVAVLGLLEHRDHLERQRELTQERKVAKRLRADAFARQAERYRGEGRHAAALLAASESLRHEYTPHGWSVFTRTPIERSASQLRRIQEGIAAHVAVLDVKRGRLHCALSGGLFRSVKLDGLEYGETHQAYGYDIVDLALVGDGEHLAILYEPGLVALWNVEGAALDVLLGDAHARGTCIAAGPDGASLCMGHADGTLSLFDLRGGRTPITWTTGHEGGVADVTVDEAARRIHSVGAEGVLRTWSLADGEAAGSHALGVGPLTRIVADPEAGCLYVGTYGRGVWRIDLDGSEPRVTVCYEHTAPVRDLCVVPGTAVLSSCGEDGVVHVRGGAEDAPVRTLEATPEPAACVVVDAQGGRVFTSARASPLRAWSLEDGDLLGVADGNLAGPKALALSSQHRLVFSASSAQIRVSPLDEGPERVLDGHEGTVRALALSPQEDRLYSAGLDGRVLVWDVGGEEITPRARLEGPEAGFECMGISPDGLRLYAGSWDGSLRAWSTADLDAPPIVREGVHVDPRLLTGTLSLAVSADGTRLFSGGADQRIRAWRGADLQDLGVVRRIDNEVAALALSKDGRRLYVGTWSEQLRVWNVEGESFQEIRGTAGTIASAAQESGYILGLALSPAGDLLFSNHFDGTILVRDATTLRLLHRLEGHADDVTTFAFSADGRLLATACGDMNYHGRWGPSLDGSVRVWSTEGWGPARALVGERSSIRAMVLSSIGGRGHLFAGAKLHVRRWEVGGPPVGLGVGKLQTYWEEHGKPRHWVRALQHSDRTGMLYAGGEWPTILAIDVERDALAAELEAHEKDVSALALADGVQRLFSLDVTGTIHVWDLLMVRKDGMEKHEPVAGWDAGNPGACLCVDDLARTLWSGHADGTVRVWEPETGKERFSFDAHVGPVYCLLLSPDRETLYTGGRDGRVRAWRAATGERLLFEVGGYGPVRALCLSPKDGVLFSGTYPVAGDPVRLQAWRIGQGTQVALMDRHGVCVLALALDESGRTLFSAGYGGPGDATVWAWDLDLVLADPAERASGLAKRFEMEVVEDGVRPRQGGRLR